MFKLVIVAAIVWWFFMRKASAATTGVIQGAGPDFDPVTAGQLAAAVSGNVAVGDDWSATFIEGRGNWADVYRSHATAQTFSKEGFVY